MSERTGVTTEVVDEVTLLKLEVVRQKDIKRIVNDTLVSVAINADKLKTENARLKELNREMMELIKDLECIQVETDYGTNEYCPVCNRQSYAGHFETCWLASVLAKAEGEG